MKDLWRNSLWRTIIRLQMKRHGKEPCIVWFLETVQNHNYRPILIEGILEASYPSSTTLLVLSVMPTLIFQVNRRSTNPVLREIVCVLTVIFSAFMVIGRLVAGAIDLLYFLLIVLLLYTKINRTLYFIRKLVFVYRNNGVQLDGLLGIISLINSNWTNRDYSYTVKDYKSMQNDNDILYAVKRSNGTVLGIDR